MFRIRPSKTALIWLASAAVVLLLLCSMTYCKQASKLGSLKSQITEKQGRLADSEQMAKRLSAIEERYLDAKVELDILEQGASTRAYVPTLLRQIEELGKSVNLRVVGVRPKPQKPKVVVAQTTDREKQQAAAEKPDPYEKLDIDIEIDGEYWDVVRFTRLITSFPKIITVNSVQMSPTTQIKEVKSPVLSVRLNTTAFILKDESVEDATKGVAEAKRT